MTASRLRAIAPLALGAALAAPLAAASAEEATTARGAEIFERQCASCHAGTDFAPDRAALAELDAAAWEKGMAEHMDIGGVIDGLSPAEIEAIHRATAER